MNQIPIYVHDPYDVFLAVGFGFCYGSALLPVGRLLERYKGMEAASGSDTRPSSTTTQQVHKSWGARLVLASVLLRGILTIFGLACLYCWYSLYLNKGHEHTMSAHRIFLDWVSLGLFAIGANLWDNQDHHENLYCLVQSLATFAFCTTCILAIARTPPDVSIPLFKAVFWCFVILSCFIINIIVTWCAARIFPSSPSKARLNFLGALIFIGFLLTFFWWVNSLLFKRLGVNVAWVGPGNYLWVGAIVAAVIVIGIVAEKGQTQARMRSILITMLPMAILIWVTIKNYKHLFPGG